MTQPGPFGTAKRMPLRGRPYTPPPMEGTTPGAGALADPTVLLERRGRIFEPSVGPLNRWVERLRASLPTGAEVPWFDPAGGGVHARLLWLGDQPAPTDLYSGGGAGFVSIDATDARSRNLHAAATAAGVDRSALVVWNATPCNLGLLKKAAKDGADSVPSSTLLQELLALLPDLEVVVLAGRGAWQVFQQLDGTADLLVLSIAEVRDGPLEGRPREREALEAVWREAVAAASAPGQALQLAAGSTTLPELAADAATTGALVLVQPISDREVVAFGSDDDLAALGRPGDAVPSVMVQSVRAAAAALPQVTQMATSGRVVVLTKESAKLLKKGEAIRDASGNLMAVVRDPTTKKFIGQLRFQELGRTAAMTTALPTLVSAIAMQQQMAAIERRLAAVQEQLDALVEDRRIELEAGLDTNLEILEDVARRVRRRDELEPSQWQRVTAIESDVRSFQKRTWAALAQLTTALDPERPAATRTKELAGLVRNDGLTRQLVQLVKAEVALARWQGLQLLHDAQEHPEELEERTEQFLADTRGRHQHLVVLARRMDAYLGAGAGASLLDRAKATLHRDAVTFREGLADVLDAYRNQMSVLGLEAPPPPPALAELTVGEQLSDSLSAVRHRFGRRKG